MKTIILNDNDMLENKEFDGIDDPLEDDIFIHVKGDNVLIRKCKFENFKKDMKILIKITGKNCLITSTVFHQLEGDYPVIVLERIKRLDEPDNLVIKDCLFFHIKKPKNQIIRLGSSNSSLTGKGQCSIINNRFENITGDIEMISVKCSNNVIFNNKILNCGNTITLRHGNKTMIAYNKFDCKKNKEGGGIRVYGEHHIIMNNEFSNMLGNQTSRVGISLNNGKLNGYYPVKQCCIYNNHFSNCDTALAFGYEIKGNTIKPNDIVVKGNTFASVNNIFSTHKEVIGVRNHSYKNNKFMASDIKSNIDGFTYTTTINIDNKVLKEFVNYQDCIDYLLQEEEVVEEEQKEEVKVSEVINETGAYNKIMAQFKIEYRWKRFEELKQLINKNRQEMKELLNEISRIMCLGK